MVPRGTEAFDLVVIGAGHAGCEAALAASRLGLNTGLVTLSRARVAEMSCNPAIGGLGKSQIVREIDALGGEMGRVADAAAIHYRRLNASRGPAVRARRVQCDLDRYHRIMLAAIEAEARLQLWEGCVAAVLVDSKGRVCGVEGEDGSVVGARAVVITSGTFLRGRMHTGLSSTAGGREGDRAANQLTESFHRLGLLTGRLKTGTPPRLDATTIDFAELEVQPSEPQVLPFSHEAASTTWGADEQVVCHLTRTNQRTHEIIRSGLDRSPLFTGAIRGIGPRYCPSIEDKVLRFPQRDGHQVVLEPIDLTRRVIYPNGISTSLPLDVQQSMVRSIRGLERAEIREPGYAVEYDFVHPTQLLQSLQCRDVPGLFLAGQINGTSGYEEAAGQGLLAGINAAAYLRGRQPVVLERHEAYLGVLVSDLVTRGTLEPYRMFSSRAEFRLLLREDNAVARLRERAERIGLVPKAIRQRRARALEQVEMLIAELSCVRVARGPHGRRPTLKQLLTRPEVRIEDLVPLLEHRVSADVLEQVEVRIKYQGYVDRQVRDAQKLAQLQRRGIPADLDYQRIPGLSRELATKLAQARPENFAQAGRIDGMTPTALMVLSVFLDHRATVPRGTVGGAAR